MRAARTAEQALRLAATRPTQQYVCLTCRAQAARQLHTSTPRLADVPFYKRLQESLFGSKESKEAERSREEKQKRRLEEVAERDNSAGLEVTTDKRGRQYEVAAIVDPTINRDYVQATSWDGLESVGSVEWVKQRADRGEQYVGFAPKKRVELKGGQWEMLLHHIAVEVLVLERAGRDVEQVCWPRVQGGMGSWVYTRNATVQPSSDGGVTLGFTQAEAEQQILQAIPDTTPDALVQDAQALFSEVEGAVAEEGGLPEYANGGGKRTQPVWMDFSLTDPTLKLAILKRTLQLTGKRLPDHTLTSASTLADLHNALRTREKAKKLAQTPQLQRVSIDAPNVKVHARRQTPIDKEREVGRWKVIEEELVSRGLPVTGSRFQGAKVVLGNRG